MADVALGYAVKADGRLSVATVSPTPRGAMVNGFAAFGIMIRHTATDDQIKKAWDDGAPQCGLSLVMVEIRERAHADG